MTRTLIAVLALVMLWSTIAQADEPQFDTSLRLSLAEPPTAGDEADAATPASGLFLQGTWTFTAYGSATFGDDAGELYLKHMGVGYHLWDYISINVEYISGYVSAEEYVGTGGGGGPVMRVDPDGFAVGFDLLVRWHFLHGDAWSVYLDGGVGLIWFQEAFPIMGTRQNFTPQAGFGATVHVCDNVRLIVGARWHHISNASKKGESQNPGFDGVMVYAGIVIPF